MPDMNGLEVMMALNRESLMTRIIASSNGLAEMDHLHAGGPPLA
jgi:hypothetical protein